MSNNARGLEAFCPQCDDFRIFERHEVIGAADTVECLYCTFMADEADVPHDAAESDRMREEDEMDSWVWSR